MPSPQYSKRVGAAAEQKVCDWLAENGWPHAERRRLRGSSDCGDVAGVIGCTIEIKAEKRIDLSGYMTELAVEMANNGDHHGVAIVKRRGTTDVGRWYAVMPVALWAALAKEAGL